MVNDQADTEGNVAVRVLSGSQIPGQQDTGPIVVINIHADNFGLGGNEGDIDIADIVTVRNQGNLPSLGGDKSVFKELDMDEVRQKEEDQTGENSDYLDFDTDYITITMGSDYPDRR